MSGNDKDQPSTDRTPTTEDAFALVGNGIRAEILRVLGDAGPVYNTVLTLSELRSRMDTDVEPSQLHYHLQQLVGHLVTKTDDGYRLHMMGYRLYSILRVGSFDRQRKSLSVAANFDCYYCQTPVEAIFEDGRVNIACSECDYLYMHDFDDLSRTAFEDEEAAFSNFSKYVLLRNLFLTSGICPSCSHPVSPHLTSPEDTSDPRKVYISQSCHLCGSGWSQTVGMALLADYDLRMFCAEHGVDVLSTPWWELEFAATDEHVTVRSTDPWEVALEVTFDGDTLELVVDGDVNVVERNYVSTDDDRTREDDVDLPDTETCLQALRDHRWPDGVTCPHCDSGDTTKEGTTSKAAQSYRCHDCDSIFNDLTGTIFAGRGLSVSEMCYIVREMDETKTTEIARQLGRSYKPVLGFVHDVQDAREDAEFDSASICPTD